MRLCPSTGCTCSTLSRVRWTRTSRKPWNKSWWCARCQVKPRRPAETVCSRKTGSCENERNWCRHPPTSCADRHHPMPLYSVCKWRKGLQSRVYCRLDQLRSRCSGVTWRQMFLRNTRTIFQKYFCPNHQTYQPTFWCQYESSTLHCRCAVNHMMHVSTAQSDGNVCLRLDKKKKKPLAPLWIVYIFITQKWLFYFTCL